jgi:hypothetical protein
VPLDVGQELTTLRGLSIGELRHKYVELFGEPTRTGNKVWLVRRLVWRLQALAEGDLSERARQRATELAHDADLRLSPPRASKNVATVPNDGPRLRLTGKHRLPPPGSVLVRPYKGQTLQVRVLDKGFAYDGRTSPSLARATQFHRAGNRPAAGRGVGRPGWPVETINGYLRSQMRNPLLNRPEALSRGYVFGGSDQGPTPTPLEPAVAGSGYPGVALVLARHAPRS